MRPTMVKTGGIVKMQEDATLETISREEKDLLIASLANLTILVANSGWEPVTQLVADNWTKEMVARTISNVYTTLEILEGYFGSKDMKSFIALCHEIAHSRDEAKE